MFKKIKDLKTELVFNHAEYLEDSNKMNINLRELNEKYEEIHQNFNS